jgi:surface polysaccharide O-acyltransferase-like enzyme
MLMQINHTTGQTHFRWVDLIRVLAAFLVVLAHVRYSGNGGGLAIIFYYILTRVAVPLFFIVSGFLLLSKNESYVDFFRKRALKVFIPFLIWSIIYLLWQGEGLDQPFVEILKTYFVKILRGPRESHLWFFYELFGLYLFTPILRIYVARATNTDLFYFCGIWFLLTPLVNLMEEFTPIGVGFEYYFLNGYIGYFVFGHLAGRIRFSILQRWMALGLFLLQLVLTIIAIYLCGIYEINTQYFEDYLSVNVVLMSCSLFVVLMHLQVPDGLYRAMLPLSRASFGIYLAHVLVMSWMFFSHPFSGLPQLGWAIYMMPFLALLGFGFSFVLVFVLQKIPVLRLSVP